ncbi:MAG: hypothetical protein K2X81_27645 [Candidatus Obscuribacterales bacterium]|nr:hypothetical protein [Candidatus Obscuribacterales bacterium]
MVPTPLSAKEPKLINSLTIFFVVMGTGAAQAPVFAEANSPAVQLKIQASTEVTPSIKTDEFDFGILKKIDTSPDFGLQAKRSNVVKKGSSRARSLVNFMFDTRGSDWSKEGADLAIGKKSDISSDTTGLYEDQLHRDNLHWQVISLIAKIGSALGSDTKLDSDDNLIQSVSLLRTLIGEAETDRIMEWLTGDETKNLKGEIPLTARLDLPTLLYLQDSMSSIALERDSVTADIKSELLPYGNKCKSRRVATKVVYSALGIATFIPNWIAPVAETSFLAAMMANGGPEQDKLLKELYYAKRLERRYDLIQKELNLALNCRAISVATDNAPLYHFSKRLTEYLCGENMERKLFHEQTFSANKNQAQAH